MVKKEYQKMNNAYRELQSTAEVIILNSFNNVALHKSEKGVSSQKDG